VVFGKESANEQGFERQRRTVQNGEFKEGRLRKRVDMHASARR
jgi:hypothetical protein